MTDSFGELLEATLLTNGLISPHIINYGNTIKEIHIMGLSTAGVPEELWEATNEEEFLVFLRDMPVNTSVRRILLATWSTLHDHKFSPAQIASLLPTKIADGS